MHVPYWGSLSKVGSPGSLRVAGWKVGKFWQLGGIRWNLAVFRSF
jgi:hypothetical protein